MEKIKELKKHQIKLKLQNIIITINNILSEISKPIKIGNYLKLVKFDSISMERKQNRF